MKVLFYLPVVTPWWFDNIVGGMIKTLSATFEVHVIVPSLWSGTGIGPNQLMPLLDEDDVNWHVLDSERYRHIRTSAEQSSEILDLVLKIDADYTLCRSADITTPGLFPGAVRYIMEARLPLVGIPETWVIFQERIFSYGDVPALDATLAERLDRGFMPMWNGLRKRFWSQSCELTRQDYCRAAGIPANKRFVSFALEYEHEENSFQIHRGFRDNRDAIESILDQLDDRYFLAVTNHPLNELHVDNGPLEKFVDSRQDRVAIVRQANENESATRLAAKHSDGFIVENSKSIAIGAFLGKPMLRISNFPTAGWMNVYNDLGDFLEGIGSGQARTADAEDTRRWYAYHCANDLFNHAEATAEEYKNRLDKPFDPDRWERNLERFFIGQSLAPC